MIIALIAIAIGGWLLYTGYQRQDSLAGKAESAMSDVGREVTGESRMPDHVWYYLGGGVLVVAGLVGLARRRG
ncbi:MAG TPA: DUF3185 family protein [Opitutaceae bacterium]